MLSRRKRQASRLQDQASDLLLAFLNEKPVSRFGKNTVLRWLVLTKCYFSSENSEHISLESLNAHQNLLHVDDIEAVEQAVSTRVLSHEHSTAFLAFAAFFFRWWFAVAERLETPAIQAAPLESTWLDNKNVDRSLVVPDVRRAALKLAQKMDIRAGEQEMVADLSGGTKSVSAVCQALRTGERCNFVHNTIMYGSMTDLYHGNLLNPVYFAIVNGRYLGRLNFDFISKVVVLPQTELKQEDYAWPLIYVHGSFFIVSFRHQHSVCRCARSAYEQWVGCCVEAGGVIGGCYDVRKCTI